MDFYNYEVVNAFEGKFQGTFVLATIMFLTALILYFLFKYEKNLRLTTKDLKSTNFELEQFAHLAANDMKEPVRNMVNFTQLLSRKLEKKYLEEKKSI